ncbi:MAG: FecR family protein [Proteobacteria bacterium]|nr:FecR family protein [Pseudomonadota bacterium]MBU1686154.1 FecR family protein [Pseudomonadota bacterium]
MNKLMIFCFILTILLPGAALGEESPIGKIKTGTGEVMVLRNSNESALHPGDSLYQSDIIRTRARSSVGILFDDNTVLSLGPESEIVIEEYIFAPQQGKFSMITRMLKGTASYLSGIIGRQAPDSVKFSTPDTTIGIRGTKFLVKVIGKAGHPPPVFLSSGP